MAKHLFSEEQKKQIVEAIKEAELNTSGEIRVHIEKKCPEDVMDRAAFLFKKLKMHKTEKRNGVLFYLAVKDHKFAIIGDAGINAVVPEGFWANIKETMAKYFKEGDFTTGLAEGIRMSGEQLKSHFPYQSDDVNELSNDISFGKE
ncbi:MAG: TPM domain-containing protein [Marinilabilia sp.]